MIWFIGFLILIIISCFLTYKTAEVHELHKIRATFDVKELNIKKEIENHKDDSSFNLDYFNGEIEELEEMKSLIDKKIEELKNYDILNNES